MLGALCECFDALWSPQCQHCNHNAAPYPHGHGNTVQRGAVCCGCSLDIVSDEAIWNYCAEQELEGLMGIPLGTPGGYFQELARVRN